MNDPIDFGSVKVGDRLSFLSIDNGFGGTGDFYERTGTVTRKTDKTVVVACDLSIWGKVGRLTLRRWHERSVRRCGTK